MMINAIAIDDEPKALQVIENHSSKISFLNLMAVFTDPFKAMDFIIETDIDLIFLDINMPDINGLDFIHRIRNNDILIIFTTAYSEYAVKSYELDAIDYLLKPIDFSRIHAAVSKVKERLSSSDKRNFFFVNIGNGHHKISYNDILYVEGNGNYVTYHLKSTKVMVRATIKETLNGLPRSMFLQIQKSFIISLNQIHKIQDNHIYIGNTRIPIGSKYKTSFRAIIDVNR